MKAFDRVPSEPVWKVLHKCRVPTKFVRLVEDLHAKIKVEFTVSAVTHIGLHHRLGVNQGDKLGTAIFTLYITAIMTTWRSSNTRPLYLFRTKMGEFPKGGRFTTHRKKFAVPDSEYANDTAELFPIRQQLDDFKK